MGQKVQGTEDLYGGYMRAWQHMQEVAASVFEPYGFEPIETPAIEQVDVFVHGIGQSTDVVRKEMFRVFSGANFARVLEEGTDAKLKAKQRLALRPEGTAGVVRSVVENNLVPQGAAPFKAYYAEAMFRGERPQKGRLREFVQCDIDILGDASPNAEVELIDVTTRALLNIGFTGFTVNINDRRILRGMLESMGFSADTLDSVCITFDKMDKIGADGVKAELLEKQLPESAVNALADFIAAGEVTLARKVSLLFTVYEEVGHGGSVVPADTQDMISVDMGCVGADLGCTERMVSICAKDSGGPYNYDIVSELAACAKANGLDYAIDVYPHYGSDVEATLTAGYDIRHGLIGPGVYASHNYERSHMDGVRNTFELLRAYVAL